MKLHRKRKRMEATAELNITAFMNLMVILVPFLLITAVFSRMTYLELNLPPKDAKTTPPEEQEIKFRLQIVVTPEVISIQDANIGVPFKSYNRIEDGTPIEDLQAKIWAPFTELLIELKSRYPAEDSASILFDEAVEYKMMIAVMDHVTSAQVLNAGTLDVVELFPNISIGDIPVIEEVSAEALPAGGSQ